MHLRSLLTTLAWSTLAFAQQGAVVTADGVVLIDQQHALTGGIQAGDSSGFPITITQPGSYRLASNLTDIPTGKNAIEIRADDVTIDLNGHSIIGPGSIYTSGQGIFAPGNPIAVRSTVTNGAVRGFATGVQLFQYSVVERIHASGNHSGIIVGSNSRVERCVASGNGDTGIAANDGGIVKANIANGNAVGITIICPSVAVGNAVTGNTSLGLFTTGLGCARADNVPAP